MSQIPLPSGARDGDKIDQVWKIWIPEEEYGGRKKQWEGY